jgi:alcohol dehydrogenase (cytochrome c)
MLRNENQVRTQKAEGKREFRIRHRRGLVRFFFFLLPSIFCLALQAQVTFERIANAPREPQQWVTYNGNYAGQRYSSLAQIKPANVARLTLQWAFQTGVPGEHETTPLVIDGVMYVTTPMNHAYAVDLRTGRSLWHYQRELPKTLSLCCAPQNRGFAALGDRLFLATLDTHLVALDSKTGNVVWDVEAADGATGHSFTLAPLVVKDKVIVGVAGGEFGVRGFIDAYDAETGERAWRFYTIPAAGEPGSESWAGDSWRKGGAPAWVTGSYDPELNLVYWGTGNPGPQLFGKNRAGDNLYSDSLVALDADTGKLKWYYQFTPHDTHDWDATQTPVLLDATIAGQPRKLVVTANRNGFFYALDRTNGKLLAAKPYTTVTWAKEIAADGRPVMLPDTEPTPEGKRVCPGGVGGANWNPPSYSPQTHLFYVENKELCMTFSAEEEEPRHRPGGLYIGSQFNVEGKEKDRGEVLAIDPLTGNIKWRFPQFSSAWAGVLSTGGGLVFTGDPEGYLIALDAASGKELWHLQLGGEVRSGPISYSFEGRQYIAVVAGGTVFTFALNDAAAPAPAGTGAQIKPAAMKKTK